MPYNPVQSYPAQVGTKVRYRGHTIEIIRSGLKVDGQDRCNLASFACGGAVGAGCLCYAAHKGGKLLIFEGATMGTTMINEQELRAQLQLAA